MKKLIIGGLVLTSLTQLYGMDSDVKTMVQLERRISPQGLELKRLLDTATLNIVKAEAIAANPPAELRDILQAYRNTIIQNATKALLVDVPSYRKLQYFRGALFLLRAANLLDSVDEQVSTRITLALKRHPSMKEHNSLQDALAKGTLSLRMLRDFLLSPANNASYYIESDDFENQEERTFSKAREILRKAQVNDQTYDNVLAELTLFDLYGTQEQQREARALKNGLIQKYSGPVPPPGAPQVS